MNDKDVKDYVTEANKEWVTVQIFEVIDDYRHEFYDLFTEIWGIPEDLEEDIKWENRITNQMDYLEDHWRELLIQFYNVFADEDNDSYRCFLCRNMHKIDWNMIASKFNARMVFASHPPELNISAEHNDLMFNVLIQAMMESID